MPRTPDALIKPQLLVWARETLGLSVEEAAKKASVAADRLAAWEAGEQRPTIAQLRKLGVIYKRPLAVFYLPEPPKAFRPLSDFRRLPEAEVGQWSPALNLAIRRAHFQRDVALELMRVLEESEPDAPRISATIDDVDRFAAEARALLGVELDAQLGWRDPYQALNGWLRGLENAGLLALQAQRVELEEMRGFSISGPTLPVVVLNGADFPRGRIFTALHEFAHVLLNTAGVCDLHDTPAVRGTDDIEIVCNSIAAAILLPRDTFAGDPAVQAGAPDGRWDDHRLGELADRYSVSREVVLRRLLEFELTTWNFVQAKRRDYVRAYAEARARATPGTPSYYRVKLRDLGHAYVGLALEAYSRDEINASDVSQYLEIKVNKLPELEAEFRRGAVAAV